MLQDQKRTQENVDNTAKAKNNSQPTGKDLTPDRKNSSYPDIRNSSQDPALSSQNSQGYGKAQSQVSGGNEAYNHSTRKIDVNSPQKD